ncbi:MAG TPA: acyl carrier protein [Firmicutes bacterium]|mgnify:CR=1 FL=1|nr:acyl carrier protein [Bacillota bacterium]
MNEEIYEKLKTIIVEQLGVKESEISQTAHFADDLGADSLDIVEMIMAVEEEFGIQVSDDEAESMEKVQDVVKFIEEHKEA